MDLDHLLVLVTAARDEAVATNNSSLAHDELLAYLDAQRDDRTTSVVVHDVDLMRRQVCDRVYAFVHARAHQLRVEADVRRATLVRGPVNPNHDVLHAVADELDRLAAALLPSVRAVGGLAPSSAELDALRALLSTPKLMWASDGEPVPYGETHRLVGDLLQRLVTTYRDS